ncbi:MAG: SH3 domain-containing protein [Anaerolineae bacterium]|nr:SH3 domain-containing protein [Anaerolineae bacterium]
MSRATRKTTTVGLLLVIVTVFSLGTVPRALAQDGQGANVVIPRSETVNIRSGPAINTEVLGTTDATTELPVTGINQAGTWWRVNSPFGVGWISVTVVYFRGALDTVPIVTEPAGIVDVPTVIVDRFPAKIYRNPNPESFVIGVAPTEAVLVVIGRSQDGDWWQVETDAGPGFVNTVDVAFRGDEAVVPRVPDPGPDFDGPTVRVNVDTDVMSEPGGGDLLGTLLAGTALPASGRNADNSWWQVASIFGLGWIPASDVSLAGAADTMRIVSNATVPPATGDEAVSVQVVVEVERKIGYNAPSFDSVPMWDVRLGDRVAVVGRSADGTWLKVTNAEGDPGWLNFSGLTLQGAMASLPVSGYGVSVSAGVTTTNGTAADVLALPMTGNHVVVNTHWLNIRSGPDVRCEFQRNLRI